MTTLTDENLLSHAETLKVSIVLTTGALNGVGRATALLFSLYGARVIVGEIDVRRGESTVMECQKVGGDLGGDAVFVVCDVSSWEDQVALFAAGVEKFGRDDSVVINAGVSPTKDGFFTLPNRQSSPPIIPKTSIIDVNLVGAMYTARLAQYYLLKDESSRQKSIIFMGSITLLTTHPQLLASHGSLYPTLSSQNIYSVIICPHVMDTSALDIPSRLGIAGVRATEVQRVAKAVVHAVAGGTITGNQDTSGGMYVLPDDGPVLWIARGENEEGVYKLVKARVERDMRRVFFFPDSEYIPDRSITTL